MTNPTVPKLYKTETFAPVTIERHVIIGTSSVIMPGVNISEGCAIGAQSLVTKSTEAWTIYVGSPARPVKARSRKLMELEVQYLEAEKGASQQ